MCGICGIFAKTGEPVNKVCLQRMTQVMRHRGPDQEGYFLDTTIGLGFRRLSIIDLNTGDQPMANENNTIQVVFNGEIYNHRELRQKLMSKGHTFRTQSDTEVIVHLYEDKGISFLNDLRGMFALALWDANTHELYLARDPFGIKPLYYTENSGSVLFASELKSLMASGQVPKHLNRQAMWNYFTFQYIPDPHTILSNVHKVPPAHYLHIRHSSSTLHAYWEATFQPDESKPLSHFTEGIAHTLRDSVALHMNADVPYGALLSSGVDSSAIVALMRERAAQVKTFSVGFSGAPQHMNELAAARQTAAFLGTEHTDIEITSREFQDQLPRLLGYLEEPLADASAHALYYVSKLASDSVKVILSGEGADELFGGYPIYHEPTSLKMFSMFPPWLRTFLGSSAQHLPVGWKGRSFLQRGSVALERRFVGNAFIFNEEMKQQLFLSGHSSGELDTSFSVTDPIYNRTQHLDDITRMQIVDIQTWLPGDILMKADKMSMINSLELRVPFLDREVFDFAATIPTKFRVSGNTTKLAFRKSMANILPEPIRTRPKLGFPVPTRQWLRTDMKDAVWDVFQSPTTSEFFHRPFIERLMREHCDGTADNGRELWTIYTFLIWYNMFMQDTTAY